jgi:16S rRNA (cytosine1402-N4)-methyltransferase
VRVLGLDRDPDAIANGAALVAESDGRLTLSQTRFGALGEALNHWGEPLVDGIVLDLGVSSMQLDQAGRGFSFRHDGPLDMRMGQEGPSAASIVNEASDEELANIFYYYGEERASRRIARAIVHDRVTQPFETTGQLAGLIKRIMPSHPGEIHPATRTFQALRMAVNDELGELLGALVAAEQMLRPGGRLVVVSFHSLEDRIVKQFLALRSGRGRTRSRLLPGEVLPPEPGFSIMDDRPVTPGEAELARNPRARTARLRGAWRLDAPAMPDAVESLWPLVRLPVTGGAAKGPTKGPAKKAAKGPTKGPTKGRRTDAATS